MANRGHVKNLLRRLSELCDKNPEIEGLILEVLSEKLHVTQDNGKSGVLTALGGIRTLMGVEDLSPSDIISIKKHVPPQVSSQVPKTESKLLVGARLVLLSCAHKKLRQDAPVLVFA